MKHSELEDLILGTAPQPMAGSYLHAGTRTAPSLRVQVDPEEKGLVGVTYQSQEKNWVTVLVLDAAGTICLQREKRSRKGSNFFQLDLRHLASGKYRLRLLSTNALLSGEIFL